MLGREGRTAGSSRRRRRRLLVGGAVVAVVAVVAAVLIPVLNDRAAPASGQEPASSPNGAGQLSWPGRGPLAHDADLLRSALRTWRDGVPERQRPVEAAVLYAGAPDGARTVLLQGTDAAGQSWAAEVVEDAGTPALRTTEPLGRTVPLLAMSSRDEARLLAPPDPGIELFANDDGTMRPLTVDGDGLSEPVAAPAAGLQVAVSAAGGRVVAGSGIVLPGRLSAVTGTVELSRPTFDLGLPDPVSPIWYGDGALLARRLGGPVTVAALGPTRSTAIRLNGRSRQVDARAYEAVRGGTRYLATVVRVEGTPTCVATAATGPVDAGPAGPPVLVSRCLPNRSSEGVVQAVAAGGVRSVRVQLAAAAKGRPARVVTVTGASGAGLVGLAKVGNLPTTAAPAEALTAAGKVAASLTVPAYGGPEA